MSHFMAVGKLLNLFLQRDNVEGKKLPKNSFLSPTFPKISPSLMTVASPTLLAASTLAQTASIAALSSRRRAFFSFALLDFL